MFIRLNISNCVKKNKNKKSRLIKIQIRNNHCLSLPTIKNLFTIVEAKYSHSKIHTDTHTHKHSFTSILILFHTNRHSFLLNDTLGFVLSNFFLEFFLNVNRKFGLGNTNQICGCVLNSRQLAQV